MYFNGRLLIVLLLGFASGFPYALTSSTLQAWLTDAKVDIQTIGLLSGVGFAYSLKVFWAPIMDRFVPPFLGRRRGWLMVSQLGMVLSIFWLGLSNPAQSPWLVGLIALIVAFWSATQDIVIDAHRTEIATADEVGPAAAYYTNGYRIAALASGAGGLALAQWLATRGLDPAATEEMKSAAQQSAWQTTYLIMGTVMALSMAVTWFSPEPAQTEATPKSLAEAFVQPALEFFRRAGAWEILLFIVLYKMDVYLATALQTTFLMEVGFTKLEIGSVAKGFGLIASIAGTMAGGFYMVKFGMRKSLLTFGLVQGIAGMSFAVVAHVGNSFPALVGAIASENFCAGLGTAAYSGFLMMICNKRYTATQYALFTSLMAMARTVIQMPSGYIQTALGWQNYFLLSVALMIPGLLMLKRYSKWHLEGEPHHPSTRKAA